MAFYPVRGPAQPPLPTFNATSINDTLHSKEGFELNQMRLRALQEVDNAKFSRFHFRVALIAGVGFFTDAYDLFAISAASVMLGYVYPSHGGPVLSTWIDIGLKIAAAVGAFFGALTFGWLADTKGRKRMYGIELVMIILGTLGQVISNDGPRVSIFGALLFWRFIMGLGIGGDYPSSAVIASEFAPVASRGRIMTAVFASQGWGQLFAAIVTIVAIAGFSGPESKGKFDVESVDLMWRILIGLGCVPGVIALFFRLTIPETPRFTMDIERDIDQAVLDTENFLRSGTFVVDPDAGIERVQAPKASWKDFKEYFSDTENLRVLIGCSYCWFALDVAFYGLSLNSPFLHNALFPSESSLTDGDTQAMYQTLRCTALRNVTVTIAGLIPGFWICFIFIDRLGRKPIQFMGFSVSTVVFVAMAIIYSQTEHLKALAALYCILNVFINFGPNTITFIIPAESFPTRYRSTAHGIAAASGKLGAIVTQIAYAELTNKKRKDHTQVLLGIYAFFTLTGVAATFLIRETKGLSLELLSHEDQSSFIAGPSEKPPRRRSNLPFARDLRS